ncbi:MAG: DUF2339 domain-containing protein [Syntrophobacteraceae bacterium]|nr:DUF2339 domain-containing protein [Syntrophobacteraceae bacterium]
MALLTIISLVLAIAVPASLILPWINRKRIQELRRELEQLQWDLALRSARSGASFASAAATPEEKRGAPERAQVPIDPEKPTGRPGPPPGEGIVRPDTGGANRLETKGKSERDGARGEAFEQPPVRPEKEPEGFEDRFGARTFVWLGAVALALAGVFLVKYSIETGLLSPAVRVILGFLFGLGLLYGGHRVSTRPEFPNGSRIAQGLLGAGIAVLYADFYAATSLYHLLPAFAGFMGMAAVTAVAVALSLRHGKPMALLGLLGGFLTPALVSSPQPHAGVLFSYLFLVLSGLMVVIRKKGWWSLGIPAVLGAYSWVSVWLFSLHFAPGDIPWLGLFLSAAAASVVIGSKEQFEKDRKDMADFSTFTSALNSLAVGGAIVLMGLTTACGGFDMTGWFLYGLLSVGTIVLARYNEKLYSLAPFISAAVNAVMLSAWRYGEAREFVPVTVIFALIHVIGARGLQSRSREPFVWACLAAPGALAYYLIAYFKIHPNPLYANVPFLWGATALALAAGATYALFDIVRSVPSDYARKQHMLAVYAGVVAAFVSIALTIELKREFLSVALAAEVAALAWINNRVDIKALRWIGALLACAFGALLVPQILLIVQLSAFSLLELRMHLQQSVPIVAWPVFQLGLPSLCFAAASRLLVKQRDDRLVFSLEAAAIALLGLMGYYLVRHFFHMDHNVMFVTPGFVERGVITNIFFLYGISCLRAGRKFERKAVWLGGQVICGMALFRIVYFDLLLRNPLWSAQNVGALPVVNGLLITYALPLFWIWTVAAELTWKDKIEWRKYAYGFMVLLAFVFVSLEVRQLFQGTRLDGTLTGNAEIYTYSAAWLLFAAGLLLWGTLRRQRWIRLASLPIVLLTAAKVFFFDASALVGLWRVFSFFCLCLSLLCISWFYSRFVFRRP